MTEDGTALYARLAAKFDLTIDGQDAPGGWELPIPAAYVAGRDGVIAYVSRRCDWSKRLRASATRLVAERAEPRSPSPSAARSGRRSA